MAHLEKAIVQEIKDDATLAPLVLRSGSDYHIYPNAIPQDFLQESNTDAVYIVYNRISTRYNQLFGYMITNIQFSIFAHKYSKAVEAREALFDIFHRFKKDTLGSGLNTRSVEFSWFTNTAELKDKDSNMHQIVVETSFKYREE